MQKFQDLLTEAAQLKQQQLKQERKNFQALPEYLKSGLNYAKKYVQLRKQHYLVQKYISQKLKKEGNEQYLLQNYGQALNKYQQALSIFRYIHATKYQNLKDQDIIYENYKVEEEYKQEHDKHLVALYLNICSALTKMNKKDEALHSSEQALKINEKNAKIYYKKAQAYLQYINRESSDIKLGFYYLNKAYELSKDQSILVQMHKIKKELDEEREKEKNWFKFMFDKNKSVNIENQMNNNKVRSKTQQNRDKDVNIKDSKNVNNQDEQMNRQSCSADEIKNKKMKEEMARFREQNEYKEDKEVSQQEKLQKTKLSLKPYLIIPRDDRWIIKYQQDFIHKHGSKIYSILQLYNHTHYLIQFKSLLAKCLQLKQAKITPQRDQTKLLQQKITMYQKLIQWIKTHPLQKYNKYIQRYHLQTQWITNNRGKPLDQVYPKQIKQKQKQKNNKNIQSQIQTKQLGNVKKIEQKINKTKQKTQQFIKQGRKANEYKQNDREEQRVNFEKENYIKKSQQNKKLDMNKRQQDKNNKSKNKRFQFKQQWEYEYQRDKQQQNLFKQDQVPTNLKAYLQNYQQLPTYSSKSSQNNMKINTTQQQPLIKNKQQSQQSNINQQIQQLKQNPFTFIKTFIIIVVLVILFKLVF